MLVHVAHVPGSWIVFLGFDEQSPQPPLPTSLMLCTCHFADLALAGGVATVGGTSVGGNEPDVSVVPLRSGWAILG